MTDQSDAGDGDAIERGRRKEGGEERGVAVVRFKCGLVA